MRPKNCHSYRKRRENFIRPRDTGRFKRIWSEQGKETRQDRVCPSARDVAAARGGSAASTHVAVVVVVVVVFVTLARHTTSSKARKPSTHLFWVRAASFLVVGGCSIRLDTGQFYVVSLASRAYRILDVSHCRTSPRTSNIFYLPFSYTPHERGLTDTPRSSFYECTQRYRRRLRFLIPTVRLIIAKSREN